MYRIYSKTKRMLNEEEQGESRVRENRTHGLVDEAEPISRNSLMLRGFTLIELLVANTPGPWPLTSKCCVQNFRQPKS